MEKYAFLKEEDIDIIENQIDDPLLIIFKALFLGIPIDYDDCKIKLARSSTNEVLPVFIGKDQNVMGMPDLTIQFISNYANNLSKEKLEKIKTLCSMQTTLLKNKRKQNE